MDAKDKKKIKLQIIPPDWHQRLEAILQQKPRTITQFNRVGMELSKFKADLHLSICREWSERMCPPTPKARKPAAQPKVVPFRGKR